MKKKEVVISGVFYDGTSKEEIDTLKTLYHGKNVIINMILPGEAHVTIY